MAAAAAFQIQLLAGGDGVGLPRYRILEIFLLVGSLRIEKRHTE